jgi:hypothetical protein
MRYMAIGSVLIDLRPDDAKRYTAGFNKKGHTGRYGTPQQGGTRLYGLGRTRRQKGILAGWHESTVPRWPGDYFEQDQTLP